MKVLTVFFVALFACQTLPALASTEPAQYSGKLYELKSGKTKLLFHFSHLEQAQGGTSTIHNAYTDLAGTTVATEETTIENGNLQKLVFDLKQVGEKGSLEVQGNQIQFSYTKDGKTKTATEDKPDNLVVGPTTIRYVATHWGEIMKGDDVDVRFAALSRLETVGFKFFKVREEKKNGQNVVVVEMKPKSFIIAAIVDPLFFTFTKDGSKVLEFTGRTVLKKIGSKTDDLDAETVYQY